MSNLSVAIRLVSGWVLLTVLIFALFEMTSCYDVGHRTDPKMPREHRNRHALPGHAAVTAASAAAALVLCFRYAGPDSFLFRTSP